MHLKLKQVLTAFLSFFVQNALLKGSYSYANVDLDPLFISVNAISLLFDRISWKLLQIMPKYDINNLCTYVKFRWHLKK